MSATGIDSQLRAALLALQDEADRWLERRSELAFHAAPDLEAVSAHLDARYDFVDAVEVGALLDDLIPLLSDHDIDSTSPRYFGLFNPASLPVTAVADAVVAMMNPQVGTWTHAPCANLIEAHTLAFFARRIGLEGAPGEAHFTSGGQEANTTALASALAWAFPDIAERGLRSLARDPCFYISSHAHDSFTKAAKLVGLGAGAVRRIEVDGAGAMDSGALGRAIAADRAAGGQPFMVVATAGTTGIGSIDPIEAVGEVARGEALWLHVDAAWAGAALMSERWKCLLQGIEDADSVTWDAHKWLDVPMGAGMLFLPGASAKNEMFSVSTGYVPVPGAGAAAAEPYTHSLQWSRRFIGLKVFMALAHLSASGYATLIEHQIDLGARLRAKLAEAGWQITNATPLPVVCFQRPEWEGRAGPAHAVAQRVLARGQVWLSTLTLPEGPCMLRACITSYRCQESDLDLLIDELERASTGATT